jgi:hypothetical protein
MEPRVSRFADRSGYVEAVIGSGFSWYRKSTSDAANRRALFLQYNLFVTEAKPFRLTESVKAAG